MAGVGELFVEISSKFNPEGINQAVNSIEAMHYKTEDVNAGFTKLGGIFTAVAGVGALALKSLINSAQGQEKANIRLQSTMKTLKIYSDELYQSNINYAKSLSQVTTYTDEEIQESERLLLTFGMSDAQMKKATKTALDLASGLGIDLRSATMILGKAFTGNYDILERYGIHINENIKRTGNFEQALFLLQKRFGGSAQAEANSFAGQIKNLGKEFDEMKETIGTQLLPVFTVAVGKLKELITWINSMDKETIKTIGNIILLSTAITGIVGPLLLIIGQIPNILVGLAQIKAAVLVLGNAIQTSLPLIAIATGIGLIINKMLDWIKLTKDLKDATTNYGATRDELIKKLRSENEERRKQLQDTKLSVEERKRLEWEYLNTLKGIKLLELSAEKEKNEKLKQESLAKSEADKTQAELDAQAKMEQDWALFQAKVIQGQQEIAIYQEEHKKLLEISQGFYDTYKEGFANALSQMIVHGESFKNAMSNLWKSLASFVIQQIGQMIAKWIAFKALTAVFGVSSPFLASFKFQQGVRNFSGGLALVGEAGPELVTLPRGANVYSNRETRDILASRNNNIVVNITGNNISSEIDLRDIADKVSNRIMKQIKLERTI